MKKETAKNRQKIDLIPVLKVLATIVLIIGVPISILNTINNNRAQEIHDRYYAETVSYIEKNKSGLANIFSAIQEKKCVDVYGYCRVLKQDEIMNQISDDLQDFSSTVFVARDANDRTVILSLSGNAEIEIGHFGPPIAAAEHVDHVALMLDGEISEAPWDDHVYILQGKEVLTPVHGVEGEIIGLIARSVVEK